MTPKRAFLTFMIACLTVCGWAQGTANYFTPVHEGETGTHTTTISATLDLSDSSIDWSYPNYEVAAFVGDQCYATTFGEAVPDATGTGSYNNFQLTLQSYSSSDRSTNLTFKFYNHQTGLEYTLTTDVAVRINGLRYTNIVLKAVEAQLVYFNDFEMEVNAMQDLSSKLTFSPSNATCPNNLVFNISPMTYSLNVTGNAGYQFTPYEAGSYDVSMSGYLYFRNGTITVNRATNYVSNLSINAGYETISVPVGDADMLGDMLSRALKITYYYDYAPDEYPVWVSDNENIVGLDATGRMTPKKKGNCTLTAQVYNPDGSVRLSASLTVKVGTFVTYINMLHSNISCNIGDDLTSYLPRTFEVQPADADNKEVAYSVIRGDGVLEQRSDGHIVAVGEGLALIQITSKDSPDVSATLSVSVQNIKNAINVKQQTLTIVNKDNIWPLDITTEVSGNVTFLPESAYFANGYPTFTSGNTDVVTIEQIATTTGEAEISAKGLTTGTALITVTMEVPNLLEQSLAEVGTSIEPSMVTGTFTVIVQRGVIPATSISLPRYDSMNVGETLDLKPLLEVYPPDADFDISSVTWRVTPSGSPEGGENLATVKDGVVTALAPGSITVYAEVVGTELKANIDIDIYQPATGLAIRPGYETITVTVGDKEALTEALTHAYVLTPANSTDDVHWTYADESLVKEEYEWFIPVKAGTTKVTYYVGSYSDQRLKAELTLVIKPLTEGIQLPASVNMNVGEQLTLADLVTVVPEGSTLDKSTIVWTVEGNEGAGSSATPLVSIADGKLTALNPGSVKLTATVPGTDYKASTTIYIYSPATAMSVKPGYETVTVFEGDYEGLTEKMSQAIVLTPANTTDEYEWMVADKSIVDYERGFFYPLKPGTTKATAYIGDKANPRLTAEVTIIVERRTVPATSISLPRYDSMNVGETLDLKPLLEVYPENADFDISTITWSITPSGSPEGGENLATVKDGVVTALAPGSITVYAEVVGTELKANIDIDIFQPATGLAIRPGYETITVTVGDKEALTEALTHAYVLTPANSTDDVHWTYADESLVKEEYEWFIPVKAGTTKVTYYVGSYSDQRLKAELTLVIKPLTEGIQLPASVNMNVGEQLTLADLVTVVPEGSPLDKSTIVWTVEGNEGAGSSASPLVSIADGKLTALNPGSIKLTATVPGTDYKASTTIYIYSPATAMSVKPGYETVTVFEGDNDGLTEKMSQAIVLTPANTTDEYEWMVADKSIVDYERGFFYPLKPGTTKATAYIGDKANPRLTAEVTIIVERRTVPATSISLPRYDSMNVGETLDLKPLLEVFPEGADFDISTITWSITPSGSPEGGEIRATVSNGVVTALAPGSITVYAEVVGTELKANIDIDIYQPATGLSIRPGYETITVTVGDKDALTEALTHAYVLTPANSTDAVNWTYSVSGLVEEEYGMFIPVKAGTTKVTYYVGSQSSPRLSAELTLIIKEPVAPPTELTITIPDPLVVGVEAAITVKGNAGATFTLGSLKVNETNSYGWKALQTGDAMKKSDGSVTIAVTPLCPGDLQVSVSHGTVTSQSVAVHIGVAATLVKGWQWKTLWGSDLQNVENMYGMNVDDIRSQLTTGSRDEDGYFGSTSTKELTAYKIKAANDINVNDAKVFVGGTILTTKVETKLYNGWTWIPYPYVHAFTPTQLGLAGTLGDRIVSKDGGFAEYGTNGWTGDLLTLEPYQSYLYYNNGNAETTLEWQPETTIYNTAAFHPVVGEAPKLYAPTISRRFRDNMTIIAQLSPHTSPLSSLTLAAFVGDECRGVSHTVDGLLFITVHGDAGEEVSFRLYDEATGQYRDVEQKTMMTPMLGTLIDPLQLTISETQGIASPDSSEGGEQVTYDLQGRKLSKVRTSSFVIRRQSDGQYRKVLNK